MYDKTKLLELLLRSEYCTVNECGRPYPPSSDVYCTIATEMKKFNSSITPKHIYVIINENRCGYKNKILAAFNIKFNDISLDISCTSAETTSCESPMDELSKKFEIILSYDQWKEIMPIRRLYGRRFKYVLQSGWTDVLAEKIWQQKKFTCTIAFKKHDVNLSSSAEYYVSFRGMCKECNALILGKIIHQQNVNVDVKIHFTAFNVEEETHSYQKKRQLRGQRRRKVANTLIDQKMDAITFRRLEANRLKNFGDVDPPIIPNAEVLRKAKEEGLLEVYKFSYANPVLNILQMSKQGRYAGAIHNIGLLQFFCIYWSAEQQLLYKARNKNSSNSFFTIDATGSVVKRLSNSDSPIFLYQCMHVDDDGSVPVFQMISADHKSMHIAYFLRKIIASGNPAPRMVVCDFGWAILIAVAEVFAKCENLRVYLQVCHKILLGHDEPLPSCFIRLDVCHFIRMISRWSCFGERDKFLVKKFYLRSLSQAYKMTSLKELNAFFGATFVVAFSKYVGLDENGDELQSQLCLRYLNTLIKSDTIPEINDILENLNDGITEDPQEAVENVSDLVQWSGSIYERAQEIANQCHQGTTINACYSPEFARAVKTHLMPYVALWSGVMRLHFNIGKEIATSSSVEAAFADLKNRALKEKLPIRADKFVFEHLNYLDGRLKLASTKSDVENKLQQDISDQQSRVLHDHSYASSVEAPENKTLDSYTDTITGNVNRLLDDNVCENWRGQVACGLQEVSCSTAAKRRKPSYLDKCPEWDYIKLARDQNIPLLRNGNISKNVVLNKKMINVFQTCAFDAVVHLVASGISTMKSYEKKMKSSENRTICLIFSILQCGKITQNHYTERADILLNLLLYKDALHMYSPTIFKLDATCNVAHLISHLFADSPSVQRTINCSCTPISTRQMVELNINIDILLQKGLQHIQDAIDDVSKIKRKCKCSKSCESLEYGPHVFIDTSIFTDDRYIGSNKTITQSLNSIATNIHLESRMYVLVGIIHYVRLSNEVCSDNNHYIAYARCGSQWYSYDDLQKKRQPTKSQVIIKPHLIFYVQS